VGDIGSILTTPDGISLRISESSILATLPATLYGQKTRATIYGIKGNKLLEVAKTESQGQIKVPISGIPKGRYLLEIRSPNQGITKPFTIIQHHPR
jgi:hypothetical protein